MTSSHQKPSTPSRPQVLIVEDEPAIARCFATFLNRNGFDAVTAADGTIALGLLSAQRWDVMVIDFQLARGPQGDDVVRSGAARDPALPARTVFTTGDISEETQRRIASAGCFACLQKPFSLSILLDAARAIVERDGKPAVERRRRA